jgi:catechol 2,3-dioxygenase
MFHQNDVLHVQEVSLLVLNLKRSLEFYQNILGLHVSERSKKERALSADGMHTLITLVEDPHAFPLGITQGLYHVALKLEKRSELAAVIKRLSDMRYPITGASDHGVSEAIYLDDPDGHGLEIYWDKPHETWPLEDEKITMYTRPMDLQGVMRQLALSDHYHIPQTMILGHLHLHVPDLTKAKAFYVDVLGFQVVMYYGAQALFIADHGYHHHIGLNTWQGDAPLCETRQIGLKSYILSVPKQEYLPLLKRLKDAHYTLREDEAIPYIIDPLNQKLFFHFLN